MGKTIDDLLAEWRALPRTQRRFTTKLLETGEKDARLDVEYYRSSLDPRMVQASEAAARSNRLARRLLTALAAERHRRTGK